MADSMEQLRLKLAQSRREKAKLEQQEASQHGSASPSSALAVHGSQSWAVADSERRGRRRRRLEQMGAQMKAKRKEDPGNGASPTRSQRLRQLKQQHQGKYQHHPDVLRSIPTPTSSKDSSPDSMSSHSTVLVDDGVELWWEEGRQPQMRSAVCYANIRNITLTPSIDNARASHLASGICHLRICYLLCAVLYYMLVIPRVSVGLSHSVDV